MNHRARRLVTAICDHFASTLTSTGRPDPDRTPFAKMALGDDLIGPSNLHSPPFMAMALYRAGKLLNRADYVEAADRCVLYLLAVVRDPGGGEYDHYAEQVIESVRRRSGNSIRAQAAYLTSRSWMAGITLDALCRGLLGAHRRETSFLSKAAALHDWLGHFRTDRGPWFRVGYAPSGAEENVDGAFSDDLGLVGRGLASCYELTHRDDVLADLKGLAGYYLRPHVPDRPDSDNGCFSESVGSWVVCPWPIEIKAEHVSGRRRLDRTSWGFSTREAVDFLTRLHAWTEDGQTRELIQSRATAGMRWAFDRCQFDDGAVGMTQRDDAFTGMAGAAVMNFLDCRKAGLLTHALEAEYGMRARKALDWILDWDPEEIIRHAGHREIRGGVTLRPAENLAWMLAWTAEALCRTADAPPDAPDGWDADETA